jgi:type II secretory pathway pseudopilin PulG
MKIRRNTSRNAFTLLETVVAAVVLAAILGAAVPMVLLVQSQRHDNSEQWQAVRAADNLLERVLAVDWAELEAGLASEAIGAAELLDAVPGGTWNLTVIEEHDPVPAKRVTVAVSYRSRSRTGNVHVTAWAFDDAATHASE